MIDTHAHAWVLEPERYPWAPLLAQAPIPPAAVPCELLLEQMQAAGVRQTVLVQPSSYGLDHGYLLDTLERFPDRFAGVVLTDPARVDVAAALRELAPRPGVRGVRLHLLDDGHAAALEPAIAIVTRAVADAQLVLTLQAKPRFHPLAARVAQAAGDVPVVLDHVGLVPPSDTGALDALLRLSELPNLYLKVSGLEALSQLGHPFRDCWPSLHSVAAAYGADRLMWGSNFPHVRKACSYEDVRTAFDLCFAYLGERERQQIAQGTAERLWG